MMLINIITNQLKLDAMKKYNLIVLAGDTHWDVTIYADEVNYYSSGNYIFYYENEVIACYPIQRTIISSIEEVEE